MLLGELDLNANPALAALHKVSESIETVEHKLKSFGMAFAGIGVAVEAITRITESFESVLTMGAHLEALHAATNESVHDLLIFGHALDITGGQASSAQNFIFKLQNAIAGVNEDGKQTTECLTRLGTSAGELRSLPILEQIETLQKGLAKIPEQADKVAVVKDLFGFRFAAQAMPLLANPESLETAKRQAEPLAAVMDKNAEKFHELEAAVKGFGLNLQGVFAGALETLAPDATDLANALGSIDFVDIGRTVGHMLDIFLKLANVFTTLVPMINKIADALAHMNKGLLGGAAAGAVLGTFAAGPLGTVLGGLAGGFLGNSFFGDETHAAHSGKGWADAYAGGPPALGHVLKDSPVGALQRIGLGGAFGGGDPLLSEAQQIRGVLVEIRDGLRSPGASSFASSMLPAPLV
jgi:hypothetical protein